jgi:hypothetical protein
MKLRLKDQGEGWFWPSDKVDVRVVESVSVPGLGQFHRVAFHSPLERQERGGATPSGLHLVVYDEAWVRSRWDGHEPNADEDVSVFLWLIRRGDATDQPPGKVSPSTWAMCRVQA